MLRWPGKNAGKGNKSQRELQLLREEGNDGGGAHTDNNGK